MESRSRHLRIPYERQDAGTHSARLQAKPHTRRRWPSVTQKFAPAGREIPRVKYFCAKSGVGGGILFPTTTLFKEPNPYPGALHVAVTPSYIPLNHRGGWYGVSPEELAHDVVFAVADAVRS